MNYLKKISTATLFAISIIGSIPFAYAMEEMDPEIASRLRTIKKFDFKPQESRFQLYQEGSEIPFPAVEAHKLISALMKNVAGRADLKLKKDTTGGLGFKILAETFKEGGEPSSLTHSPEIVTGVAPEIINIDVNGRLNQFKQTAEREEALTAQTAALTLEKTKLEEEAQILKQQQMAEEMAAFEREKAQAAKELEDLEKKEQEIARHKKFEEERAEFAKQQEELAKKKAQIAQQEEELEKQKAETIRREEIAREAEAQAAKQEELTRQAELKRQADEEEAKQAQARRDAEAQAQQPTLLGYTPERIEHNVSTEARRGVESVDSFLKTGKFHHKKHKKNKK